MTAAPFSAKKMQATINGSASQPKMPRQRPRQGGKVKLLPITRLHWLEMVNDHPDVSAAAVRVAIFIGRHWETNSLQCHIARETIAEALSITIKWVTKLVAELERLGLLGVHRFVIGRRKDGSIAYGGTGNANTFLFPFETVMAYLKRRQAAPVEASSEGSPAPSEPPIRGKSSSPRYAKSEGTVVPTNSLPFIKGRVGAAPPPEGGTATEPTQLEPQKPSGGETRGLSEREPSAAPVPSTKTKAEESPETRARVLKGLKDLADRLRANAGDPYDLKGRANCPPCQS
jgi:hypothetical protein